MNSPGESVLVSGAGVSGLTTAICLAEAGQRVRVWTAEPPHQTTSAVAGAVGPRSRSRWPRRWPGQRFHWGVHSARRRSGHWCTARPAVVVGALPADGELPPQAQMIRARPCTDEELPPGFEWVSFPDAAHGHAALPSTTWSGGSSQPAVSRAA